MPGVVTLVCPPALAAGDGVAVIAPASAFPRDDLLRGVAWLRTRYRVNVDPGIFARDGYLAGDDARRARELEGALRDPEVKAVFAARGGYGAMRLLDLLPPETWRALRERPKWIVGFSDVTALHVVTHGAGVCSLHGPNVTGLGRDAPPEVQASLLACLEGSAAGWAWSGLRVLRSGQARGPIAGGNLSLIHAMAAAGSVVVPEGAVLALEDVTEAPYRIDRMLTSLRLGGHLSRASAIVFGDFTRCAPGPDGRTVEEVLVDRTADLGVPVLAGAPFGHEPRNEAFVLGREVTVREDTVTFEP